MWDILLPVLYAVIAVAVLCISIVNEIRLRKLKKELAIVQEQTGEIKKIVPWLVIQRNVLCQSLWATGVRGYSLSIHPSGGPDDPETRVAITVTGNAVTISAPGQEEFVMRMTPQNQEGR